MTTVASTTPRPTIGAPLSAAGIVRSEWIKLRTVRSTLWCYGLLVVLVVGVGILIASFAHFGDMPDGAVVVELSTAGINFAVLIIAVLGSLIITGEYSTGMIRSTFAAAPRRTGALAAKAVVLAVTAFVATAIAVWVSALVAWPILAGKNVATPLGDPHVFLPLLGGAVYVAMIALLAFGFGTLLRSTAGSLATVLGLLLVAPVIVQLLGALTKADWVNHLNELLPQVAGSHLFAYRGESAFGGADRGDWITNGWEGFGVLAVWVVVVLAIALIRVKRRDA